MKHLKGLGCLLLDGVNTTGTKDKEIHNLRYRTVRAIIKRFNNFFTFNTFTYAEHGEDHRTREKDGCVGEV